MAAGCGAARSWGCVAAEASRFPTECAGDALAQFDGSEPDTTTEHQQLWVDAVSYFSRANLEFESVKLCNFWLYLVIITGDTKGTM